MITLRPSHTRGHADHGWLRSQHSFSFADYHDPAHMGVGNLRVINEDRIAPGTGFGTHGHRDMEIVSYVLSGALAHRDSIGNEGQIRPGDVQRMSAGTGVRHSEFNALADADTHFLQIWILPRSAGVQPGYEQRHFSDEAKRGRLLTIASGSPDDEGAVALHADARIHAGLFDGDESASLKLDPERPAYVFLARGALRANGQRLAAGDALRLDGEALLKLDHGRDAEVLVFELAG